MSIVLLSANATATTLSSIESAPPSNKMYSDTSRTANSTSMTTNTLESSTIKHKTITPAAGTIITKSVAVPVKTWVIRVDDRMISNTLSRWAQDSGYQLVWDSQIDFPINAEAKIHGTFRYALNEVLKSFKATKHPLKADWYLNNVIVIKPFD